MISKITFGVVMALSLFLVACAVTDDIPTIEQQPLPEVITDDADEQMPDAGNDDMNDDASDAFGGDIITDIPSSADVAAWQEVELTDVQTGDAFTFAQLNDVPVLVQNFAVWCPNCKRQQDQIKLFLEQHDVDVHFVSLATDPNEGTQQVSNHAQQHGFDWHFAVSPTSLTQQLIAEFGSPVVFAPREPMILICPGGSSRFLPSGSKPAQKLLDEIQAGC